MKFFYLLQLCYCCVREKSLQISKSIRDFRKGVITIFIEYIVSSLDLTPCSASPRKQLFYINSLLRGHCIDI